MDKTEALNRLYKILREWEARLENTSSDEEFYYVKGYVNATNHAITLLERIK